MFDLKSKHLGYLSIFEFFLLLDQDSANVLFRNLIQNTIYASRVNIITKDRSSTSQYILTKEIIFAHEHFVSLEVNYFLAEVLAFAVEEENVCGIVPEHLVYPFFGMEGLEDWHEGVVERPEFEKTIHRA